jgi:hypothetical protein
MLCPVSFAAAMNNKPLVSSDAEKSDELIHVISRSSHANGRQPSPCVARVRARVGFGI